jgi:hypothetical protein
MLEHEMAEDDTQAAASPARLRPNEVSLVIDSLSELATRLDGFRERLDSVAAQLSSGRTARSSRDSRSSNRSNSS